MPSYVPATSLYTAKHLLQEDMSSLSAPTLTIVKWLLHNLTQLVGCYHAQLCANDELLYTCTWPMICCLVHFEVLQDMNPIVCPNPDHCGVMVSKSQDFVLLQHTTSNWIITVLRIRYWHLISLIPRPLPPDILYICKPWVPGLSSGGRGLGTRLLASLLHYTSMNFIFMIKGLDVIQSHPLHSCYNFLIYIWKGKHLCIEIWLLGSKSVSHISCTAQGTHHTMALTLDLLV